MSKKTVLLIGKLAHTGKDWKAWSPKYTLKEFLHGSRKDFLKLLQDGEYDDVVGLYRSNTSVAVTGPFDHELISLLPSCLKYICHNGAGYDNIDIKSCTDRGIAISSTPIAVNDATADIAMFLILGALRQITIPLLAIRDGKFKGETPVGHDPKGKTLGILGMGGIGRAVAKRARAFGMNIAYHNRSRLSSELEGDASYLGFEDLLVQSDVLSLNLSLNGKTRHIISSPEFDMMKDGVVIINTARGALINEKDLVAALESGKVAAAGLDVFENEPDVDSGLLKNPRVVLLPHIGTNTYETQKEMELLVLKNLENGIENGTLLTPIPEQRGMFGRTNDLK